MVHKSGMVVQMVKFRVSKKMSLSSNFPVSKSGMVVPTLYQRCTSVVVPVYGMLPWVGGRGNVWLKNNVVPVLGQHWDFASIDNHYTTIIRVANPHTLLLLLL